MNPTHIREPFDLPAWDGAEPMAAAVWPPVCTSDAAAGERFAEFAGTLSSDEAREMQALIDAESGNIEGEW